MRLIYFGLVFFLIVFLPATAMAAYISFDTTVTTTVKDNKLVVQISAVNRGDEAAHDVLAEIKVLGQQRAINKQAVVKPGDFYRGQISFDLANTISGQYPLVATLYYTDANHYGFSALIVQAFAFKTAALAGKLVGAGPPIEVWEKGTAKVVLQNNGDEMLFTETFLVLPRELAAEVNNLKNDLRAKTKLTLEYPIKNLSALNGSTYQVYAVCEYRTPEGRPQVMVLPLVIKVAEPRNILGINYLAAICGLGMLIIILAGAQFFKKK